MTYLDAISMTYTGAMVTRESFSNQVYIIRDLSVGGDNPPLYYNDETGTKVYTSTSEDEESVDWKEFVF